MGTENDVHLRAGVVPPDGTNDVRLYAAGSDPIPPATGVPQRTMTGMGL